MLYLAIALFAISAAFGIAILIKWLTQKDASKFVIFSHGLVAVVAVLILVYYAIENPNNFPKISIILFVLSAIGGLYMFIRDMNKKNSPLAIAFIHALLAVSGLIALLAFVFI